MVAAPVASGWTGNNDGGGVGLSFTTPGGVTATQSLVVFIGSSSNGDTINPPATGTWANVAVPDNVVTSSGGQYRAFECLNPASTTLYAFTMAATRRTLVWVLMDGADLTGGTSVAIASSLESAAAGTHAPPSVVPPASGLGVLDCLAFRQFNPDASSCSPPAAGLTWTELQDVRGLDLGGSGQNIQMAVNYAVAGTGGVAISTSPLNTVDTAEPAMVLRLVFKSAAGGSDVTITDTSGGSGAAGSADAPAAGVVKQDTSGGVGAAGSTDVPSVGVVVQDSSGGSGAAGSADALAVGVALTDTSGGLGAAGSTNALQVGVAITDSSGGSAGSGSASPGVDVVITDTSGGASAVGSAGLVLPGADVTIGDTSGGGSAGGSTDSTASSTVRRDTMVMPILQQALACLRTEASLTENPPAHYHVRPGGSFEPSADAYGRDECCDGIGWARMVANYEGQDANWLEPAGGIEGNCAPIAWAVVIEIGLMRCVPLAGDRAGSNVTDEQWTAATQAQMDDAAALRRVLCCLRDLRGVSDVVSGQVTPLENSGGCGGVTLTVTIRADACDC